RLRASSASLRMTPAVSCLAHRLLLSTDGADSCTELGYLCRTDAIDGEQVFFRARTLGCDRAQRPVREDAERWLAQPAGFLFPPSTQPSFIRRSLPSNRDPAFNLFTLPL